MMNRKNFIKKSVASIGTIVALPALLESCSSDDTDSNQDTFENDNDSSDCVLSPSETAGPFPIKTPADLVRENIISDRSGVALMIILTIQDQSDECNPITGIFVDIWHCDADGNYSEYGATQMQSTDYTSQHFLRGRGLTDANGQISFISIFPGWYQGRAPHIHIKVLDQNENSLRVSQIAFPKSICDTVYATTYYHGVADTSNITDNIFSDSLDGNMVDSLTGNTTDGFTLLKTIIV